MNCAGAEEEVKPVMVLTVEVNTIEGPDVRRYEEHLAAWKTNSAHHAATIERLRDALAEAIDILKHSIGDNAAWDGRRHDFIASQDPTWRTT